MQSPRWAQLDPTNTSRQCWVPLGHPRATRTLTWPCRGDLLSIKLVMLMLRAPCPWTCSSRALRVSSERLSRGRRPVANCRLAVSGSPCTGVIVPPLAFSERSYRGQSREGHWWGSEDCPGHPACPWTLWRGSHEVCQLLNDHRAAPGCPGTGKGCICYPFSIETLPHILIGKTHC